MPPIDPIEIESSLTPGRRPPARARRALLAILALQIVLSVWWGWSTPRPSRWWDERFNVSNIETILERGRIAPANAYYGGSSYLPQTLLVAASQKAFEITGRPWLRTVLPNGRLSASGYRLCRLSQVGYGALAVLLIFGLGLRLAAWPVALLASFWVAISPRLVHASAIFKPDIELLAFTLVALLASETAVRREPHLGRYLWAGVAIGLATGAKLNGVTIALPLALATVLRGRDLRRWGGLCVAALTSFLTFWAFNPRLGQVWGALGRNRAHYERTKTGGLLDVLREVVAYPFDPAFLGPVLGGLATLGGLGVLAWGWRRFRSAEGGGEANLIGWAMTLVYAPGYLAVYSLASPRAKANHFLQLLPFAALCAAVAAWSLVVWANRRHPGAVSRVAVAVGVVVTLAWPAARTVQGQYRLAVPATSERARWWLEDRLPEPRRGRRVLVEERGWAGDQPGGPTYLVAIAGADGSQSADIDGRLEALDGSQGGAAMLRDKADREVFRSAWFWAQGEPVAAALSPWARVESPANGRIRLVGGGGSPLRGLLPEGLEPATYVSIRVRLALDAHLASELTLRVGEASYPLTAGPASVGDVFFLSPRFQVGEASEVEVHRTEGELQSRANSELFVWNRPSAPGGELNPRGGVPR